MKMKFILAKRNDFGLLYIELQNRYHFDLKLLKKRGYTICLKNGAVCL